MFNTVFAKREKQIISFKNTTAGLSYYWLIPGLVLSLLAAYGYNYLKPVTYHTNTSLRIIKLKNGTITSAERTAVINWIKKSNTALSDENRKKAPSIHVTVKNLNTIVVTENTDRPDRSKLYYTKLIAEFNTTQQKQTLRWVALLKDSAINLNTKLLLLKRAGNKPPPVSLNSNLQQKAYAKQIRILEYLLTYVNKPINTFTIIPDNFDLLNANLKLLINQFNNLHYVKQELVGVNSSRYPGGLSQTADRISAVKNQILTQINLQKDTLEKYERNFSLNVASRHQIAPPVDAPVHAEIFELRNRIDLVNQKIYRLLTSVNVQAINLALLRSTVTLNHSNWLSTYLYIIACFFAFTLLYSTVRNRKHFWTAYEDIGTIDNINTDFLLTENDTQLSLSNGLFTLATQLIHYNDRRPYAAQTIAVTSKTEYPETTGFCVKLANILSASAKVVLVDLNLDEPTLLESTGTNYQNGLTSYLNGKTAFLEDLIVKLHRYPKLSFIGAGPKNLPQDNILRVIDILREDKQPTDRANSRLPILVGKLKSEFTYIILYAPNHNPHKQSDILNRLADIHIALSNNGNTAKAKLTALKK